jgi:FAD dependent oxidoreductase
MPEMSSILSSSTPAEPCPLPTPNSTKSFWHSEPDKFLLGHRSTPNLPKYAKNVIVGSGITGASAARYFDELFNEDVLMLEAREACWGATGRVSSKPFNIV